MKFSKIFFWKKQQKIKLPFRFGIIKYTSHAKEKALYDDENLIVEIYEGGDLKDTKVYSEELVEYLREIEGIPVEFEKFEENLDYDFAKSTDFGSVKYVR